VVDVNGFNAPAALCDGTEHGRLARERTPSQSGAPYAAILREVLIREDIVVTTAIRFDERRAAGLQAMAANSATSADDLVRCAVDEYPARRAADDTRRERFDALVTRLRDRLPSDPEPAELGRHITAAREEVRAARRAARSG